MAARDQRLLFVALLFTSVVPTTMAAPTNFTLGDGSTGDIEKIILARCRDYTLTRYLDILPRPTSTCTEITEKFFQAFKDKAPCTVRPEDYDAFYDAAKQDLPADKHLFWSRVYALAHVYNDNGIRHITLEDTLVGYLANTLNWCGQVQPPGINYDACPAWGACELQAMQSFWTGASEMFAKAASGEVFVMLDGSNPDRAAYAEDSFFRTVELPNLPSNVTSVEVLLSHSLGRERIESCSTGSIADLETDVKAKGFAYHCEDSPQSVVHLQCANDPENEVCELEGMNSAQSATLTTFSNSLALVFLTLAIRCIGL